MSVDISGLDKLILLHALWRKSPPVYISIANGVYAPPWNVGEALKALSGYIEQLGTRMLDLDLREDNVDPTLYDIHCREGTLAQVVTDMKSGNKSDFY